MGKNDSVYSIYNVRISLTYWWMLQLKVSIPLQHNWSEQRHSGHRCTVESVPLYQPDWCLPLQVMNQWNLLLIITSSRTNGTYCLHVHHLALTLISSWYLKILWKTLPNNIYNHLLILVMLTTFKNYKNLKLVNLQIRVVLYFSNNT